MSATRMRELASVAADPSLGVVARTRARVELALLSQSGDGQKRWLDEVAALRDNGAVGEARRAVEAGIRCHHDRIADERAFDSHLRDLQAAGERRRHETKLQAEEARRKCVAAERALRDAERESESAMEGAEKLMKEARKSDDPTTKIAAKEAMFETRAALLKLHEMQERAVEERQSYAHALEEVKALEDSRLPQDGFGCTELSEQVAKLQEAVNELQSTNRWQQAKISSLEENMERSGSTQSYRSAASERQCSQPQRDAQRRRLQALNERMASTYHEVRNMQAEVKDLYTMKMDLQRSLSEAEESAKAKLQALADEVATLLHEKERALGETEAARASCKRSLAEHQEAASLHSEELRAPNPADDNAQEERNQLLLRLDVCRKQVAKLELTNKLQKINNDKIKRRLATSSIASTATTASASSLSSSASPNDSGAPLLALVDASAANDDSISGLDTSSIDAIGDSASVWSASTLDASSAACDGGHNKCQDIACLDCEPAPSHQGPIMYKLSSRSCPYLLFCGKTSQDLNDQAEQHYKEIWRLVKRLGRTKAGMSEETNNGGFGQSLLATYCAGQCRDARSLDEVLDWCAVHVRMQQQVIRDNQSTDDRFLSESVFHISCQRCKSNLYHNHIGPAPTNLADKVWKIVKREELSSGKACGLGAFGSMAEHFAKHCAHAKSKEEVERWCDENVKVERLSMVKRSSLIMDVDSTNAKDGLTVSFKVESTFERASQ